MDWIAGEFAPVRLIRHSNDDEFGTGFAVYRDQGATWLVTCAHVANRWADSSLCVGRHQAEVVADGRAEDRQRKIDLTVLKVPGLSVTETLKMAPLDDPGHACRIIGWRKYAGGYRVDSRDAVLVRPFWRTEEGGLIAKAWDLAIQGEGLLEKGYSGAPVICAKTGAVLAVAATNDDSGKTGTAVCISHLREIWPDMPEGLRAPLMISRQCDVGDPASGGTMQPTYRNIQQLGLLRELARLFDKEEAAKALLEDAGIPTTRVKTPFSGVSPELYWQDICRELNKGLIADGLPALFRAARRTYEHNPLFNQLDV